MSIETNNQGFVMDPADMEKILRNAQVHRDTPIDMGYGFDFSPMERVVELTPLSYAGEQQAITIVRPAINKFMLTKPA